MLSQVNRSYSYIEIPIISVNCRRKKKEKKILQLLSSMYELQSVVMIG